MKTLLKILLILNIKLVLSIDCLNQNYYISDQNTLDKIENCSIIHGNLIINSGYKINDFGKLQNLKKIKGYLNIIDNHNVSTLYGLDNLESIEGNNLYLNLYSVVIKYNINERNDTHEGLCYTDNVIWENITNYSYDIRNNGINCPDCHEECIGCWGPGPNLCQKCLNYNYNGTCVPHCPGNYTNSVCDDIMPSPPILTGNLFDLNNIYITWSKSNNNDFISGYKIWVNDNIYYTYFNNDLGYYYNNIPSEHYINNLNYSHIYNIKVSYVNQLGESLNSSIINITTSHRRTTPTSTVTTTPTSTLTTTPTSTPTSTLTSTLTSTVTTTNMILSTVISLDNFNTEINKDNDNGWNNLFLIIIILFVLIIFIVLFYYCKYGNKKNRITPNKHYLHIPKKYNRSNISVDYLRSHQNTTYESLSSNYGNLNSNSRKKNSTEYNHLYRPRIYNNSIYSI